MIGVTDEVEHVVSTDGCQRDDGRLIADGRADESVTVAPEQAVTELTRLDRFAEPTWEHEDELAARQQPVGVLRRAVDGADRSRKPPNERHLPQDVLSKRPDGSVELVPHRGHGEKDVQAQRRVVRDEKRGAGRNAVESLDFDVKVLREPADALIEAPRRVGPERNKRVLVLSVESVDRHGLRDQFQTCARFAPRRRLCGSYSCGSKSRRSCSAMSCRSR